jgi:hypothetical protein
MVLREHSPSVISDGGVGEKRREHSRHHLNAVSDGQCDGGNAKAFNF